MAIKWPHFIPFKDDLIIGRTRRLPFSPTYRLRSYERRTHCYVLGITGQGKSKLLEHMLYQDIMAGRGCGLIDPHTDLAWDLLADLADGDFYNDPQNLDRIIYFDPSRSDYLIPFNVLSTSYPAYETAANVVEAFRRTWPESLQEAPRFSNILLAGLLALIANHLTLAELPRLLTDQNFREGLLAKVDDPEIASVFHDRLDKWGKERALILESILNKVSAFTLNPTLRLILGQSENRLDFRRIIDEGKVLIADLGRCDGETRRLIGSLLVTGLEQAALSRKNDPIGNRRPFYFYMDEFQDFVANEGSAVTLSQILSEARKFGLHITLAHQILGQMASERIRSALGNVGTKIVFAVDRGDAEIMAKKLFAVSGEEVKHDIEDGEAAERTHPVFYSLQEEWEQVTQMIQNLSPRTCLVKAQQRPVAKVHTITLPPHELPEVKLEMLRHILIKKSGRSVRQMRQEVEDQKIDAELTGYEVVDKRLRQQIVSES